MGGGPWTLRGLHSTGQLIDGNQIFTLDALPFLSKEMAIVAFVASSYRDSLFCLEWRDTLMYVLF